MKVKHLKCVANRNDATEMHQMERKLEKGRISLVFRCIACQQKVEISREARKGETLGITPKD
jgi:hypothetical protein